MLRATAANQRTTNDDLWLYIPFSGFPLLAIVYFWWIGAPLDTPVFIGIPTWLACIGIAVVGPLFFWKKCAYYVPVELLSDDDVETVMQWYENAV